MTYYKYKVEIYEHGRWLRKKKNNDLITVDYVELSTKGGKFVHWLFSLRITGEPQRSQPPSTTSSLASTHLQEVHQFTGMVLL